MAVPETKVFVQFDLEASSVAFFTLDDPVQGVLDGIYGLGGDVLEDVTQFVASISIGRGKSRELDRFTAGQASVTFHNDNRWFDPFYVDSPYFEQFVPKRQVVITTNGVRQYTGYIDDIDLQYNLGNKSFATITCTDAFSQISSSTLETFTNTVQKSGDRVNEILSRPEVSWPLADRNIDTGQQTLQADVVTDGTNALGYLQLVESSEPGSLFISKDGKVTFKDRSYQAPLTETIVFADDDTALGVAYNNIEVVYGSENLYNNITITRAGGTAQIVNDTASQAIYGIQSLNEDGLLMETDADALTVAQLYLDQYSTPELRFSSVGFTLHDKTQSIQDLLCGLEISDVVRVVFTPNGIGDPISEYAIITGISHNVGIDNHSINFEFGSTVGLAFVLDSDIYGVLGGNLPLYDDIDTDYDSTVKYDGSPIEVELYGLGF
jgi:hypothetical protein